jgi:plasmid stability protein
MESEDEIRDTPESTVRPPVRLRMGTALGELGRRVGLTDDDIAAFEQVRDKTQAEPVRFEPAA